MLWKYVGGACVLVLLSACGGGSNTTSDARVNGDASLADGSVAIDAAIDARVFDAGPLADGVTTIAGSGQAGYADGLRTDARLNNPANVAVASDGTIYVADFDNGMIRAIDPWGNVTTLTDQGNFSRPFGLVMSSSGVLYAQTDRTLQLTDGGALWSINASTGTATLLFNNIGRPRGMAELSDGRLVMAFYQEHVIKIYDPSTPTTPPAVVAGGLGTPGMVDDTGTAARFDEPYDVVAISATEVVVSDKNNYRLRKVDVSSGVVTTYAGNGNASSGDGTLLAASFNLPQGLAIDGSGNIYVSELGGYVLRKISGSSVTSVAGDGTAGFLDNTNRLGARFWGLEGIDVTSDGAYLYVADGNRGESDPYNRVRRVTLP